MWLFERLTLIHGWHLQDLTVPDCNVSSISTCSSRMTKSTEIHQNQQPQVTEIRVKPNQDAQNDLGGHETQSEIQKAGPKGPSVKPVAQRQSAAAHCRAPRCRSGGQRKAGEECP